MKSIALALVAVLGLTAVASAGDCHQNVAIVRGANYGYDDVVEIRRAKVRNVRTVFVGNDYGYGNVAVIRQARFGRVRGEGGNTGLVGLIRGAVGTARNVVGAVIGR